MPNPRSEAPILHPEEQALREELARLRASVTALLLQRDELTLIQCRRIEAAYLRRFGALELRLYESWCDCLRAKKKAKLIRARQNRRAKAELPAIEAALDQELSVYREELERRFAKVNGVLEPQEGPGLSAAGRRELRELYRKTVKALHPDLNPGSDQEAEQRLQQAMRAYRAGDLETLRTLCDGLSPADQPGERPLETLRAEAARLRKQLRDLDRELEAIKAQYPYAMRVYLEDEDRGRQHQAELDQKLRELQQRREQYEAAIGQMLAGEENDE